MSDPQQELADIVDGLSLTLPSSALDQVRADWLPPQRAAVESVLATACSGERDPHLEQLVESYRRGEATWSMLVRHPRVVEAMCERTEAMLG